MSADAPQTTPAVAQFIANHQIAVSWLGWAISMPREPWLYVEYGGDEATAWRHALGWPDVEEIAYAKANGARAFPVSIWERMS